MTTRELERQVQKCIFISTIIRECIETNDYSFGEYIEKSIADVKLDDLYYEAKQYLAKNFEIKSRITISLLEFNSNKFTCNIQISYLDVTFIREISAITLLEFVANCYRYSISCNNISQL